MCRDKKRREHEKDVFDKCGDQPKLFCRYINKKLEDKN